MSDASTLSSRERSIDANEFESIRIRNTHLKNNSETKTIRQIINELQIDIPSGGAKLIGDRVIEELGLSLEDRQARKKICSYDNTNKPRYVLTYSSDEWDVIKKHIHIKFAEMRLSSKDKEFHLRQNKLRLKQEDIFSVNFSESQPHLITINDNDSTRNYLQPLIFELHKVLRAKQSFNKHPVEKFNFMDRVIDLLNALWFLPVENKGNESVNDDNKKITRFDDEIFHRCQEILDSKSVGIIDHIIIILTHVLFIRHNQKIGSTNLSCSKIISSKLIKKYDELEASNNEFKQKYLEHQDGEGKTIDEIVAEHTDLPPITDSELYKQLTFIDKCDACYRSIPKKRNRYTTKDGIEEVGATPFFMNEMLIKKQQEVAEYHNQPQTCKACKEYLNINKNNNELLVLGKRTNDEI